MQRELGFNLIELVLVMIIIGAGLVGLASMFSNNAIWLTNDETLQRVTQYAQECAERVISARRDNGYLSTTAPTLCDSLTLPGGFSRTVSAPVANTTAACPTGNTCSNITVTVSHGGLSSSITLMQVDY